MFASGTSSMNPSSLAAAADPNRLEVIRVVGHFDVLPRGVDYGRGQGRARHFFDALIDERLASSGLALIQSVVSTCA